MGHVYSNQKNEQKKIHAALSMLENADIRESERKRIRDMAQHN